jgi:hypothetical protein
VEEAPALEAAPVAEAPEVVEEAPVITEEFPDEEEEGGFRFGPKLDYSFEARLALADDETKGYWLMTMAIDEPFAETEWFKTDYVTTKANFDGLLAQA